jgi:DNA-binding NarL/FixJ family response regulator
MLKSTGNAHYGRDGELHSRAMLWRSLVVVSPSGMPECLLFALEREFEALHVIEVSDMEAACVPLPYPAALLLIDGSSIEGAMPHVRQFSRIHPLATVAVMVDHERIASHIFEYGVELDVIRGVLPMNLKLDLWLSVVGLMMRGGEYFPSSTFRQAERRPVAIVGDELPIARSAHSPIVVHRQAGRPDRAARHADMRSLTEREYQVLQLVARGTQNKLIAAELGLSEHTVKIHIHNVIRKLGSRNRTEAAAMFLQSGSAMAEPARAARIVPPPK